MQDFDPDDHEPASTHELEVTLTFEVYEFWTDAGKWLEARPIVVRNDLNEYYEVATGPEDLDMLGYHWRADVEQWLTDEIRDQ